MSLLRKFENFKEKFTEMVKVLKSLNIEKSKYKDGCHLNKNH